MGKTPDTLEPLPKAASDLVKKHRVEPQASLGIIQVDQYLSGNAER